MWWRRSRREEELRDEIQSHLALAEQDRIDRGLPVESARAAARREFGNVVHVYEATRAVWAWPLLEHLARDTQHAWRGLRRSPGFAAAALLTLGLGIGANAAVFSVVDAAMFRPLPYRDAD